MGIGSGSGRVVEHLPRHQKVKGSSLVDSALIMREKIEIKMLITGMGSSSSDVVEHLPHNPKVKGSSLALISL
jgi:hypothetical protein